MIFLNLLILFAGFWVIGLGGNFVIPGIALALFAIYRSYVTQSL